MKLLLIPLIVLLVSFTLKKIIDVNQHNQRYIQYGGWPSTHTALITSLATVMGLNYGLASAEFAISVVLAAIIISDAATLRPVISRQSKLINQFHEQKLPDHLGHKVNEIIAGAVIGIGLTIVLNLLF